MIQWLQKKRLAVPLMLIATTAMAQTLQVPIYEYGGDDLPTCASSIVSGLNPNGDGFLAVRSGPGSEFDKLDEIHNGDKVLTFDQSGPWYGVLYGDVEFQCSSEVEKRLLPYDGKKGWVHGKWLKPLAG